MSLLTDSLSVIPTVSRRLSLHMARCSSARAEHMRLPLLGLNLNKRYLLLNRWALPPPPLLAFHHVTMLVSLGQSDFSSHGRLAAETFARYYLN